MMEMTHVYHVFYIGRPVGSLFRQMLSRLQDCEFHLGILFSICTRWF